MLLLTNGILFILNIISGAIMLARPLLSIIFILLCLINTLLSFINLPLRRFFLMLFVPFSLFTLCLFLCPTFGCGFRISFCFSLGRRFGFRLLFLIQISLNLISRKLLTGIIIT